MQDRKDSTYGVFITFEGDDGVGKSTQADLIATKLETLGMNVVRVHEPGGTSLGEKIREILLSKENDGMCSMAELMLYEAARAQAMFEMIVPALASGAVVVSDRFTDSTIAYQGYGRELGKDVVTKLNDLACGGVTPTRTLLLAADPTISQTRMEERLAGEEGDRLESAGKEFHQRLREGFARIAANEPGRVHIIDANGSIDDVTNRILNDLADILDLD